MTPAASEIAALDAALERFDEAHATLVQAARRIQHILALPEATAPREEPPASFDPNNGRSCPRCHSTKLVNRGGGCLKCAACQFDLGCGGT